MKITKFGHCCLKLKTGDLTILTDPGSFTIEAQEAQDDIDVVLITHEHGDHLHMESVMNILAKNPGAKVVTNASVAALLKAQGIEAMVVGDGQSAEIKGVSIEGFGREHAPIYGPIAIENTGYLVAGEFYFPGDNFHNPGRSVRVLALPVAGPWMKISEAIDFAKLLKPQKAFGVHDGMIVPGFRGFVGVMLEKFFSDIEFSTLEDGEEKEL